MKNKISKFVAAAVLISQIFPVFMAAAQTSESTVISRAFTRTQRIAAAKANLLAAADRVGTAIAAQAAADARVVALTEQLIRAEATRLLPPGVIAPFAPIIVKDLAAIENMIIQVENDLAEASDDAVKAVDNVAVAVKEASEAYEKFSEANKEVVDDILDVLEKLLFEQLKKRILDMIVDQIVGYIQGEGEPRFITDWQGFMGDIANQAAGEFAQELGLGLLCEPFSLKLRLQFSLPPVDRFRTQIGCTLDKIVGNIENFYNDFRNGTWIAWDTSWQPQNNYLGSYLLTFQARDSFVSKKVNAAFAEASANSGFLSVKKCYDENSNEVPEGTPGAACVAVTPGKILGDTVAKAVGSDIDYIVNAQDLSAYVTAITNALINRMIREGAGLAGVSLPNAPQRTNTRNEQTGVLNDFNGDGVPDNLPRGVSADYANYQNRQGDSSSLPPNFTPDANNVSGATQLPLGISSAGGSFGATRNTVINQIQSLVTAKRGELNPMEERLRLENQLLDTLVRELTCEDDRVRSPARYPFSTRTNSYWSSISRRTSQQVTNQTVIKNNLQEEVLDLRLEIEELNRQLVTLNNITDSQFNQRRSEFQDNYSSLTINSSRRKRDAESALASAQTTLTQSIQRAQNDLNYCLRGF